MIAIIPARKGSKRLPNKNMMELCGKPLIYWTIQAALNAEFVRWVVITTDCPKILKTFGDFCDIRKRPSELAQDDTPMHDVVVDVLNNYRVYDAQRVILLQPTSPLRDSYEIDAAIRVANTNVDLGLVSLVSTCDTIYRRNGAIYIMPVADVYNKNVQFDLAYIMDKEDSIDIDTIDDFKEAERLMNERNKL